MDRFLTRGYSRTFRKLGVTVFQNLRLAPVVVDRSRYLPPMLLPLVKAAKRGDDIVPALLTAVHGLGFSTFGYATANYHVRPDNDERMYVFTTAPPDWMIRYDQFAYVECDPRVLYSFDSALPFVWDQASQRGRNASTDQFLIDAAAHGIASGVSFPIYSVFPSRNMVTFSSPIPVIDSARRDEIIRNLGEMILFGQYFHELFMKAVIEKGLAPLSEGAPLSLRERQCLQLASCGLTSFEIGGKLAISDRTVNFHFSNMISKLGVRNRHEAIAKGTRLGMLQSANVDCDPSKPRASAMRKTPDGCQSSSPPTTIAPPSRSRTGTRTIAPPAHGPATQRPVPGS